MFIRYHKDGNYRRDFHHVGKHEIEKDLLYRLKRIGISPGEHLFTGILSNPHSLMGYCLSKKTTEVVVYHTVKIRFYGRKIGIYIPDDSRG